MSDVAAITEDEVRALLRRRPTSMLLTILEMTEATRDDLTRAALPLGVLAAVQIIDWVYAELDARYPLVMAQFYAAADREGHLGLIDGYRRAWLNEAT